MISARKAEHRNDHFHRIEKRDEKGNQTKRERETEGEREKKRV